MTLEKNADHVAEGLLKFAGPFWGKPRWAALYVAFALEIQELENVLWDILEKRLLANATGVQLRVLGKLVGQSDPGLGEDVFRLLIKVRIRINRSQGLLRDLQEVLQLLDVPRRISGDYPAKVRVEVDTLPLPLNLFRQLLEDTLAAGVGLVIIQGGEDYFEFQDAGSSDPAGDFGDAADPDAGAFWSSVI
jgi:hypothetical protein